MVQSTCSVKADDHSRGRLRRGMCERHYRKYVQSEGISKRSPGTPCKYHGCGNNGVSKTTGYCSTHHRRLIKHGSPDITMKGKAHKVHTTEDGLRVCTQCGEGKPLGEYHRDKGGSDGYRAQCKSCRSSRMSEYYLENQDSIKNYERGRRLNLTGHMREIDRKRYRRNRAQRIASASDFVNVRRSRKAGVLTEPGVTVASLRKIHGDKCCYCEVILDFNRRPRSEGISPDRATLEHIVPISRGGSHTFLNSALACHECNVSKNSKTVEEWEAWKAGELYGREEATSAGTGRTGWRAGTTAVLF